MIQQKCVRLCYSYKKIFSASSPGVPPPQQHAPTSLCQKAFSCVEILQGSISITFPWPGEAVSITAHCPSVKQKGSPYKGVQKNPHDQSTWEWQPCRGLAIIRPHESLSSPPLLVGALTVTHPAMTVTSVQRASRRQGPTTSNEAVKGPLLVNCGKKHLLILTYSSRADTHCCAPSHCLRWEKLFSLDLISFSTAPPPHQHHLPLSLPLSVKWCFC